MCPTLFNLLLWVWFNKGNKYFQTLFAADKPSEAPYKNTETWVNYISDLFPLALSKDEARKRLLSKDYYPRTFKQHTKPAERFRKLFTALCSTSSAHPFKPMCSPNKTLKPRFINAYHARGLNEKKAKLTQPQRSCPRAKSVASYFFHQLVHPDQQT